MCGPLCCGPPRAIYREGSLQDACRRLREMKSGEFLFGRECEVGYITPRAGLTGEAFAKIVCDDEVKPWPSSRLCARWSLFKVNPVEHLDQLEDTNLDSRFFQQFASDAFFQTLANLQHAARDGPFAAQRFAAATYQQRAALIDNNAPDANHRLSGVLSGRCHSNGPSAHDAMAFKAALSCTRAHFMRRGISYAA